MSLLPTKEVPHTCKIVNYFLSPIYFSQGEPKLSGEGFAERGKGVGARRVGEGGGARGWGGWWGKGVGRGFN